MGFPPTLVRCQVPAIPCADVTHDPCYMPPQHIGTQGHISPWLNRDTHKSTLLTPRTMRVCRVILSFFYLRMNQASEQQKVGEGVWLRAPYFHSLPLVPLHSDTVEG